MRELDFILFFFVMNGGKLLHFRGAHVLICITNEFESEDLRDLRVCKLDSFIHTDCPAPTLDLVI